MDRRVGMEELGVRRVSEQKAWRRLSDQVLEDKLHDHQQWSSGASLWRTDEQKLSSNGASAIRKSSYKAKDKSIIKKT
jgi:hypothetical protein